MASIRLISLRKVFTFQGQRVRAVDGVTLEAPEGKILTLLGPSGCGKTTVLRCIAGLERPDDGEIRFGEQVVFSRAQGIYLPPERRNIGMVFQSYAIWPHLTVFENVAYPLRVRRLPPGEIRRRVEAALELVGLGGLGDRPAPLLSGGQQQRVALARALVYEPQVLLLDEPLSNLDAKVREQVREELRGLQRKLGITTVYVTHDQVEALSLSDVVAVMREGRVEEVGTPQQLYERPRTRFVAEFVGTTNLFTGRLVAMNGQVAVVETDWGRLQVRLEEGDVPRGERVWVGIRPEHVVMEPEPTGDVNVVGGRVLSALFEGTVMRYRIALAEGRGTLMAYGPPVWRIGEAVYLRLDPRRILLLRQSPSEAIAHHSNGGR
ncbi:MAG: ABC transporter ATP-binding protein [Armatimonadota bacterium]|nr:ABC transporter ATP-binding protein [Armatimonadota bacterium]MDR7445243.1 ABC transporter ATP-binding protein [Armatimonadota bacterium]MDR7571167.1 ABC transporter ATP-binding protein [Armatimonadota bacterium]MDR7615458.1 ABC transporter ATP-binding protein [Armatimonadota bacterium]